MNIRADSQNPLPLPFLSDHHQRDGKIFRVCSLTAPMTYKLSNMDCSMPVDLLLQICKAMPIADLVRLLGVNRPLSWFVGVTSVPPASPDSIYALDMVVCVLLLSNIICFDSILY